MERTPPGLGRPGDEDEWRLNQSLRDPANQTELKALETAWHDAREKVGRLEAAKRKYVYEEGAKRVNPLRAAVAREERKVQDESEAKFGDDLRAAYGASKAAESALDKARVAMKAAHTGWYPVGTVVCYWEKGRFGQRYFKRESGVVEIFGPDSERPEKMGTWRMPNAGDLCVRFLKKDGTPGKKFVQIYEGNKRDWLPEGETPKEAR